MMLNNLKDLNVFSSWLIGFEVKWHIPWSNKIDLSEENKLIQNGPIFLFYLFGLFH